MISIKYGDYTAIINPSRGANCISLRNSKYDAVILREPNNPENTDNPYLYGMPVLYPANRISDGCFEFEGRIYKFPINEASTNCHLHGVMHETEFDVAEVGESCVTCVFENRYLDFPHKFRMEITYTLSENGMEHKTKITNLSDKNMPNFLGFHTTFNVPFISGSKADDVRIYAEIGNEAERDENYLPTGRILACDDSDTKINAGSFMPFECPISKNCKIQNNGKAELHDLKNNIKVVYENDMKFDWRLLYNGNADGFLCIEPMTCMANCQNSPFDRKYAGFDYIAPYKSKEYVSKIFLTELI